jgi:hypothetical protein
MGAVVAALLLQTAWRTGRLRSVAPQLEGRSALH